MLKGEKVLAAIGFALFVCIVVGVISYASNQCDGTLVRGLVWLECIKYQP